MPTTKKRMMSTDEIQEWLKQHPRYGEALRYIQTTIDASPHKSPPSYSQLMDHLSEWEEERGGTPLTSKEQIARIANKLKAMGLIVDAKGDYRTKTHTLVTLPLGRSIGRELK